MASRPPEARSKEYRICTHPDPLSATLSLNHCYKAPHQIPSYPSWDTQFLRIQACCFSFCLESNKVILSMNTSPKTLSLRFNSALVHRGQVFSISFSHIYFFSHNLSALEDPNPSSFVYLLQNLLCMCRLSCVRLLCNPRNCNPPGSSVHGIIQTKPLEWVAIPFSRGLSWAKDQTHILHW